MLTLVAQGQPLEVASTFSRLGWLARRMEIRRLWSIAVVEVPRVETDVLLATLSSAFGASVVLAGLDLLGADAVGVRRSGEPATLRGSHDAVLRWAGLDAEAARWVRTFGLDRIASPVRAPVGDSGLSVAQAVWRPSGARGRPPWVRPVGFDLRGNLWVELGSVDPRGFPGGTRPLVAMVVDSSGAACAAPPTFSGSVVCWLGRSGWRQVALLGSGTHAGFLPDRRLLRMVDLESLQVRDVPVERPIENVITLWDSFMITWRERDATGILQFDTLGRSLAVDPRVAQLSNLYCVDGATVGIDPHRSTVVLQPGAGPVVVPAGRSFCGSVAGISISWDAQTIYHGDSGLAFPSVPMRGDTRERMVQRELYRAFADRRRSADDAANAVLRAQGTRSVRLEDVAVSFDAVVAAGSDSRLHFWRLEPTEYLGWVDLPIGASARVGLIGSRRLSAVGAIAEVFAPEGSWDPAVSVSTWDSEFFV